MALLEQMLSGEIEMREYLSLLTQDEEMQKYLNSFVPQDSKWNPNHPLWKAIGYQFFYKYDFDLYKAVTVEFKMDDSIGDNVNIFGTIARVFLYTNPDFTTTTTYLDRCRLEINITSDCFEGLEVNKVLESIVDDCLNIKTKTGRIKAGKQKIKEAFHVTDRKRPWWIQGAEWPMGKNSPMKFIEQKRHGEEVEYLFVDVDTGETRKVIQYY